MQTFPQTIFLSTRVKWKYFFQYSRWYSQWGQVGLDSNSVTSKIWDGSWLDSLTQQHRLSEIKQPWIPAFPGNAAPHGQTPHGIQSALFSITKWANVWPCRGADCPRPSQWKHVGLENTYVSYFQQISTQHRGKEFTAGQGHLRNKVGSYLW